jgi:outer membrane receptor protein involved in Fe transport
MGNSLVNQGFGESVLSGDLFKGWAGTVNFAAGLTYRNQNFNEHAEPRSIDELGPPENAPQIGIRGIPAGYTGGSANLHQFSTVPDVAGSYNVWEYFGELNIPIYLRDGGPQRVDGSLSYRSSNYSTIGRVQSWKMGLEAQILSDLRFRTTQSRDVREATFSERYDFQGGGGAVNDPRFNNTSFQITTVSGGNPNLKPEMADTTVAGFVYEPSWFSGLRLSADWYDIKIKDAIGTLGVQRIVDECEGGNTSLCSMITRDPATGFIGRVINTNINIAKARVRGIDYEAVYQTKPNFFKDQAETLNIRALAGYIIERSDTPLGGQPLNQAGWLATPDLTAIATATYGIGAYSIQLQERYTAPTQNRNTGASSGWVIGRDVDTLQIASATYTNLQLGFKGETGGGTSYRIAFNITNLFNRDPPIVPSYGTRGGAQVVPFSYDIFGRRYQINLNMSF